MSNLSHEQLRKYLSYDPATGKWRWLVNRTGGVKAGDEAGGRHDEGRWRISVLSRPYFSARLAWFYMTGEWPPEEVDHKDRDPGNDRWDNLRLASDSQNQANRGVHRNSILGIKGVRKVKNTSRYAARILVNGKSKHLGCFATVDEASAAYLTAAQQVHGAFAHG